MTEPRDIDIEKANPNPDEVTDDGLGTPEPPEVVTDAEVDESDADTVTITGDNLVVTEDDGEP